jgi:hypothetical protein
MNMRYFYDTEFHEDGQTIDLLSIGIVAEDGREYYAVNAAADWGRAAEHDWLRANVLPYLPVAVAPLPESEGWDIDVDWSDPAMRPRRLIAQEVAAFIAFSSPNRKDNELWAYYSAYDHVALCQLFGRMIDLPPAVPMFTNDLQQVARTYGVNLPELAGEPEGEHNALADARWNRHAYNELAQHAARHGYYRRA